MLFGQRAIGPPLIEAGVPDMQDAPRRSVDQESAHSAIDRSVIPRADQ